MNRLASASDSPSESLSISADIDLGLVAEEVVITMSRHASSSKVSTADGRNIHEGEVAVLLDVTPRASWLVRTQPGALRRIIMNLLGMFVRGQK
jgi:signal transduction histidine kinase